MESNGELVAQTSSAVKKKRRKAKRIGYIPKRAGRKVTKSKESPSEDAAPAANEEQSESFVSEDDNPPAQNKKPVVANKRKRRKILTQRVNDLISEEERKQIESHYYVDLSFVDKRKVKKSIFAGDNVYRCKLCQTAYPRLDKCQVGCHFFSLSSEALFYVRQSDPFIFLSNFGIACFRFTFGVTSTCCRTFVTPATLRR